MKVGFLLLTSPEHENSYTVGEIASALLDDGHEVEIFLMSDGVYNVVKKGSVNQRSIPMGTLMEKGAKLSLCTMTTEARGLAEADLMEGVELASQHQLSKIVANSDRFLTFG